MSAALRQSVADYLAVRRSLGYKLARPEKLLGQFISYLEQAGAATVTTEHALAWAVLPGGDLSWHAYRLAAARGFAAWLRTTDPAAQIPPAGLIPSRKPRATPYLYTDGEVAALIAAAGRLRFPLRTATYQTLIGLLAATGMRVGEAISLDRGDADLDAGVLTVRHGKQGKSRLVPVHDTTARALGGYLQLRDRLCPDTRTQAVLISPGGSRLLYRNVHATWTKLAASAGLKPRSGSCGPASTTSATLSPSAPCSTATSPAGTGRPRWRCCPPTSATWTRARPTGITPISGLFRYLLLCARDGSVAWDDALWRVPPVGIIQWVSCAHEASFLTFSAHVIVPPCSSGRRAGSPGGRGQCHGVDGVRAG